MSLGAVVLESKHGLLLAAPDQPHWNDLRIKLEREGTAVDVARSATEACDMVQKREYEAILLGLHVSSEGLPAMLKRIRGSGCNDHLPVILITEQVDEEKLVQCLQLGRCDFLATPVRLMRLRTRLIHLLRSQADAVNLTFANLEMDRNDCRLMIDGSRVGLTPTEFKILEYFLSRPESFISREELRRAVWSTTFDPGPRVIDVPLHHLRAKLGANGAAACIVTVWGFGFRLTTGVTMRDPKPEQPLLKS
ncbi:MAG: response regulator transcription factor [Planctomycetes bacterium]|nr:response regulator transcription factor [Planctomycetota bacterium]